jgi:hypothetical protein
MKIRGSPITGEAADRTPHVPLAFDVGMVEHGVPMPADVEAPLRLAFHQHGAQARPVLGVAGTR